MEWRYPDKGRAQQLAVRRAAWQRLESEKQNSQQRREVCRASKEIRNVRTAAKDRILRGYAEDPDKEVCIHNQWGFFRRTKSLQIEDARKVNSQSKRDKHGALQHHSDLLLGGWVRGFSLSAERAVG